MVGTNAIAGVLERAEHCSSASSSDPTSGWDDQWDKWDEIEGDPNPGGWGDVMEGEDAKS